MYQNPYQTPVNLELKGDEDSLKRDQCPVCRKPQQMAGLLRRPWVYRCNTCNTRLKLVAPVRLRLLFVALFLPLYGVVLLMLTNTDHTNFLWVVWLQLAVIVSSSVASYFLKWKFGVVRT